jgi:hypothetical protein
MPRVAPHHHPCQTCRAKVECGGEWQENYDGFPEVICPEWHRPDGTVNNDFVCEACYDVEARALLVKLSDLHGKGEA